VADLHRGEGLRIGITTSHPAVIAHCRRSPAWAAVSVKRGGSCDTKHLAGNYRSAVGRAVVSFEKVETKAESGKPEAACRVDRARRER
jgi:hypothetical protein